MNGNQHNGTQAIVYNIIKENPELTSEMITFHAMGQINESRLIRKRIVSQAIYRLSRQGKIKSINKEKPHKWVVSDFKE